MQSKFFLKHNYKKINFTFNVFIKIIILIFFKYNKKSFKILQSHFEVKKIIKNDILFKKIIN